MSGGPFQTRVFFENGVFANGAEIRIEDDDAIERDADASAIGHYLFSVPFTCGLEEACPRRNDIIDRSVVLFGLYFAFILFVTVIEDLNLHSDISSVALPRHANADTVVAAGFSPKFETKDEIRIFLFSQQIAAAIQWADQNAVSDDVPRSVPADERPSFGRLAVEERNETFFIVLRQDGSRKER